MKGARENSNSGEERIHIMSKVRRQQRPTEVKDQRAGDREQTV